MALPFPKKKNTFNSPVNKDQEGFWWKNVWRQGKKALKRAPKPLQSRGLLFEALEPRVLMSADLSYGTATDLTLTYIADTNPDTPNNSEYHLINSSGDIVSTAKATDASSGGIKITGTAGSDILRLDLANLNSLSLTFLGDGDDSLAAVGDFNFSLSDFSLTAGSKSFAFLDGPDNPGFEKVALTGGGGRQISLP